MPGPDEQRAAAEPAAPPKTAPARAPRRLGLGLAALLAALIFFSFSALFAVVPHLQPTSPYPHHIGRLQVKPWQEIVVCCVMGEETLVFGVYSFLAGLEQLLGHRRWLERLLARRTRLVLIWVHVGALIGLALFILVYIYGL